MQSLGEDASPLLLRIKLRHQPKIDADTVESIRQLSEKKLSARKCSLLQALLIHKALPLLEKESSTCDIVSMTDDVLCDSLSQQVDTIDDTSAMECTPPRRRSRCDKRSYEDLPVADDEPNLSKARRRLSDGSCESVHRRSIGNGPCLD
eukprot:m.10674 g.10674  ORF g.10674 m.10674 type:complete len:149 (+) comp9651_c0_seq1:227-673(+)